MVNCDLCCVTLPPEFTTFIPNFNAEQATSTLHHTFIRFYISIFNFLKLASFSWICSADKGLYTAIFISGFHILAAAVQARIKISNFCVPGKMPQKFFQCNKCMEKHERPVNATCQRQNVLSEDSDSLVESDNQSNTDYVNHDLGLQILTELKNLSGRIQEVEKKVEQQEVSKGASSSVGLPPHTAPGDKVILPTAAVLRRSAYVQREVDSRLQELRTLNEQGKFKSQRGGSDTVYGKHDVPWPHNYILTGNTKSRASYDNLSMFQWVAGFCQIIREQNDPIVKNQMLDYMADLMGDSHDFGWQVAKGCHAVLLVKMEEGKVVWGDTNKIDRIRRAHAQKVQSTQGSGYGSKKNVKSKTPLPCRFYQRGTCGQSQDHENGGSLTSMHVQLVLKMENLTPTPPRTAKKTKNE